jgi:hypothetical protein
MDYKAKYLKYKAKYLEAKTRSRYSNLNADQIGGDHRGGDHGNPEEHRHVSKEGPSMTEIENIMKNTTISTPEKPLEMPSDEDVNKNEDLKKISKSNERSQSRALIEIVDVYVLQPNYMDEPSKAITKFLNHAQYYGPKSFFASIYNHYINYGANFINNSTLFAAYNSTLIQEDPINGVFIFQANNGFVYQASAYNIGVTGLIGRVRAIIWAWVQTIYTTNASYMSYLDRIARKINKTPELQQSSGITSYSGTSVSFAPGYMDSQEWYYMMIIGFLTRGQGYFSISAGGDNYTYYLITSLRQV